MSPRNGICGGSGSIRDSHATAAYSIETDMTTDGKAIFITGASTGIGRASALALADAGHTVYAGVRGESAGAALVDGPHLRCRVLLPHDVLRCASSRQ